MRIAISQKRLYMNQPEKNFELLKQDVLESKGKADLIVFSELALSSALYGHRLVNDALIKLLLEKQKEVIKLSKHIPIVFGNIMIVGDQYYNALFYAKDGKLEAYGFEEEPFDFKLKNLDFIVSHEAVETDKINIVLGLKPYNKDLNHEIYPNTIYVGSDGLYNNGNEVYVLDDYGYVSYKNKCQYLENGMYENKTNIIDLKDLSYNKRHNHTILNHLIKGIKYFDEENLSYKPKWIVGVSGGLDSALSVTLLTLALGKERVHGVTLPGPYTRDISLQNANHLFNVLDISHETIQIHAMVDATVASMNVEKIEGLAYENIQARLRGHSLMTIASIINGVVSNNGNKIESALGYATLYGDAIGAFSILADLTKLEVGNLASEINETYHKEIIPTNLIPNIENYAVRFGFAPSAELSQDQFDPMKWGYHDHLVPYLLEHSIERFMEQLIDNSVYDLEMGHYLKQYNLSKSEIIEDLEWVYRQINTAVFKRTQTPPVLKVSGNGFTPEAQVPLYYSSEYIKLKNKYLG